VGFVTKQWTLQRIFLGLPEEEGGDPVSNGTFGVLYSRTVVQTYKCQEMDPTKDSN